MPASAAPDDRQSSNGTIIYDNNLSVIVAAASHRHRGHRVTRLDDQRPDRRQQRQSVRQSLRGLQTGQSGSRRWTSRRDSKPPVVGQRVSRPCPRRVPDKGPCDTVGEGK